LRSSSPGPAATAAFVVLALVASIVILVVRERSYERDPQLRARAGLVDAGSDISLMRSANFVTVTPGLHVEARRSGNRLSDRSGVLPAAIAPDGPARILSSAQRRFGLRPGEFERLTLDVGSGDNPAGWAASWSQPSDDDGVVAALDGTDVRRPFTPPRGAR
jgi:hypothetical protein